MEGETLLYHKDTKKFCRLNGTAALMWECLEQARSVDALARDICDAYDGVEMDRARSDVQAVIDELLGLAIILEA
jgi:hypothetical protein